MNVAAVAANRSLEIVAVVADNIPAARDHGVRTGEVEAQASRNRAIRTVREIDRVGAAAGGFDDLIVTEASAEVVDVGAETALELVLARAADQDVMAVTTREVVGIVTAAEGVVARVAINLVEAGAAINKVVVRTTPEDVVAGATAEGRATLPL